MKKDDVFGFEEKQKELLSKVRQLPPGTQALKQLALLRSQFDWKIEGYRNTLNILSDTTYQDRKHFLLELIQNADDAQFNEKDAGLTFIINNDSIELRYNEHGFTVEDVIAITGAGVSTKTDRKRLSHSFIGEKGIGFKSVFALASSVEIESPPWHFMLSKDKCIVPKVLYSSKLKNGEGTLLKVEFSDPSVIDDIAAELSKYVSGQVESFLFLQRLACFRVEDLRKDTFNMQGITIQPSDRSKEELVLTTFPDEETRKYLLYKEEVEFSAELVSGRWERLGPEIGPLKRQLIVAAQVNKTDGSLPEGRLFCFLPTSVTLPLPIFLQIDGHTKADRERLHDPHNNEWNKNLLTELPKFLSRAILSWRKRPEIADRLPVYIPIDKGTDQLADVFDGLIDLLKSKPWVRTFDNGKNAWVSPGEAVMATEYWSSWFKKYPSFRVRAEKLLGKKFVCPEWAANNEWKNKLSHYGVKEIDERQITIILTGAKLPKEMLKKDDSFVYLYRIILNLPSLNEPRAYTSEWFRWRDKYNSPNAFEIRKRLLCAPIYPFKRTGFGPLQIEGESAKVFWLSGESKRETGLEGTVQYRIIDKEYTYEPKVDTDATPETKSIVENKKVRNDLMRKILTKLNITELSDETIFSKIQLPWLREQGRNNNDNSKRLDVLHAIFKAYRAKHKRGKDDDYLKQLSKLAEVYFESESGSLRRLNEIVLPEVFRFEKIDHLYGKCERPALKLSDNLLQIPVSNVKLRKDWREFLIYCGIIASPKFIEEEKMSYNDHWEFKNDNENFYDIWMENIDNKFTLSSKIEFLKIRVDECTNNLLINHVDSHNILSDELYKSWCKDYGKELDHFEKKELLYDNSPSKPFPGYFMVSYMRRQKYISQSEDPLWAGINRDLVQLKSINSKIASPSMVIRVSPSIMKQLKCSSNILPLVLEGDIGKVGCYHPAYLKSLKVRVPKITDVNSLWGEMEEKECTEIIKVAVEFLEAHISGSGLEIYDREAKRLRPATDFKLGREGAKGIPLIERQYGEPGRKLGELLNLPEENEINSYLGLFENIFEAGLSGRDDLSDDLHRLLKHWQGWDASSQGVIANDLQKARDKYGFKKLPVVIFNDPDRFDIFRETGIIAIALNNIADDEIYGLEQAVRVLGLLLPEEAGKMEVTGERPLDISELEKFNRLYKRYLKGLKVKEKSRLASLIAGAGLGDYELLGKKVFRVDSITRVLGENPHHIIQLELPYLDHQEQRFYVVAGESLEIILARLLSVCEFSMYKHAKQDIQEVLDKIRKEDAVKNKSTADDVNNGGRVPGSKNTRKESADVSGIGDAGATHKDENKSRTENEAKKVAESNSGRSTPSLHGEKIADVAAAVREGLTNDRLVPPVRGDEEGWKVGLDPDQEKELRNKIGSGLIESLIAGPVLYEKKLRKSRLNSVRNSDMQGMKVVDPDASDPKAFLQAEYSGRCQICSTELRICNGSMWFETYRIYEPRGVSWWTDRPFNILSLCPNCHALAKHGGRDMSNIYNKVGEVLQGDFFPEEVVELKGDFYIVPIIINGEEKELKLSKVHMSYIVELFKAYDEAAVCNEEE
ncbi:MAG TPA: hypothetical protein DCK76_04890 [Desulfotomaculum sp.]|nr:MAG: Uncharacterized protein XD78_0833 [Desulfotomaculum sp. 46_296]HAG10717.1 hypothetical protein [Desulfotomaculum sp.]